MAEQSVQNPASGGAAAGEGAGERLEQGAYEIIRQRLAAQGAELRRRLAALNEERKRVFGTVETELLDTQRVTTAHNCVARDLVSIGGRVLLGYNVTFGLKQEIAPEDVFALYRMEDAGDGSAGYAELPLSELLGDEQFRKEFRDLYRFYKGATFAKFFVRGAFLYMKFRIGRDADDFKAFKWRMEAGADGAPRLAYVDNRSDHELRYPAPHEVDWKQTTRDDHRPGAHPHVAVLDTLFVDCIGGDLTIKAEDNTSTGRGLYAEPVENPDQGLDDAEIAYAQVGSLILLRIRPYQERRHRYFIYNRKLREVRRADGLAHAALLLPDDHGVLFAGGFYLESGRLQAFPNVPEGVVFERRVPAPNGEDHLFVFYHRGTGEYALVGYNVIAQDAGTPVVCHGFSLLEDGRMVLFRAGDEPQRHHALQLWRTPYAAPGREQVHARDSYLAKVGNRDIVRGMAECHAILNLVERRDPYADLYIDIAREAQEVLDSYYWLKDAAAGGLAETLGAIRATAEAAVGEFEKVRAIRRATLEQTEAAERRTADLVAENHARMYDGIGDFVAALAGLRTLRGEIIALRELRYADPGLIDRLEARVVEQADGVSRRAVGFLLRDDALDPYRAAAREHAARVDGIDRAADAKRLDEAIQKSAGELEMLIDVVGGLKIEDATQRTAIVDAVSGVFAELNAARSRLQGRLRDLSRTEGAAEFASRLRLLDQTVAGALELSDTPEKTEEQLTRVMLQLEEVEARFAEFDEFAERLAEKREEIHSAFEDRRLRLAEARARRGENLAAAAERVLKGVRTRAERLGSAEAIHAYFAGDPMVEKLRSTLAELRELGEGVRADEIAGRLDSVREEADRRLRDRDEPLDGRPVARFGRFPLAINTQAVDLTTTTREGRIQLHLSGTAFFEPLDDPCLDEARDCWDQHVVSESPEVYRGEYLAHLVQRAIEAGEIPEPAGAAEGAVGAGEDDLLRTVQRFMAPRYAESYTKGVHDHDAALILRTLLELRARIGLLRYPSRARALALLAWEAWEHPRKPLLAARLAGFGQIRHAFPSAERQEACIAELTALCAGFAESHAAHGFDPADAPAAGAYLFAELIGPAAGPADPHASPSAAPAAHSFAVSPEAAALAEALHARLRETNSALRLQHALEAVAADPVARHLLARDWLHAFVASANGELGAAGPAADDFLDEAARLVCLPGFDRARIVPESTRREIAGLVGDHPRINGGVLALDYAEFDRRLTDFRERRVPRFEAFTRLKQRLVDDARRRLRIGEFTPRVPPGFVRNRLVDEVFLPLIGANLAKQMGAAGDNRAERSGLLLLISPPGYGKTTLMEYVAARLGVVFMKINGPALGHEVTALDPASAPNAAAREELEKLNLAFEMGDNILIYVDDIQHVSPEFLQKFISLCDAQRKIEGVYRGRPRTYDFRGRRVAVVMAGNPYTESGERFRIPDMLANRADTYNLGDIIGDRREAFELSYIENAVTSNPALAPLARHGREDVLTIARLAADDAPSPAGVATADLKGGYAPAEIADMISVMRKLLRVRDVVLRVNQQYIRSAAQDDRYRTEPPFLLQGSYRNMNRLASRVSPVMNDAELESLILSAYEQDAQTLTKNAEANLLKLKVMLGCATDADRARWEEVKRVFQRHTALGGDEDSAAKLLAQLAMMNQTLTDLASGVAGRLAPPSGRTAPTLDARAPADGPPGPAS